MFNRKLSTLWLLALLAAPLGAWASVPVISSLSPSNTAAGGAGGTLTVYGSNFRIESVVRWNGSIRLTSYVSPTQLRAIITAADLATPGTATITVYSRGVGGGTSSSVTFTITAATTTTPAPAGPAPGIPTTRTSAPAAAGGAAAGITITPTSLPYATVGSAFSQTLSATGGSGTGYTWSAGSSSLPPGLALASSGVLSGTPTSTGTYSFSVQATDSASNTTTQNYSLTVLAPSAYGNVGDPYEGGSPPGGTALSACRSLAPNTSYYLTTDVGGDATAICFPLANGVTLDLRGHTVTGRMNMTGLNANGITIFNGTVNCSIASFPNACIHISSSLNYTAKTRIHHITTHNAIEPGTGSVAAIYFEWSGLDGMNLASEIDHITGYVGSAPTSGRAAFLRVVTGKKTDIHDNDFACSADTSACNLMEIVPPEGYVNGLIHNNRVTIPTNTISGGLPRAITISGPDSTAIGSQGWRVYNNLCTANNGRCFRFRQVNDLQVHDNQVFNCAATMGYGCYHFADPSNGAAYVGDANARIYNETIQLGTGGVAFWLRNGNGWTVKDVTVVGTHGQLGLLDTPGPIPPGSPVPTSITFCRISGGSGLNTDSAAHADTTVNILDVGTWRGAGRINILASCP